MRELPGYFWCPLDGNALEFLLNPVRSQFGFHNGGRAILVRDPLVHSAGYGLELILKLRGPVWPDDRSVRERAETVLSRGRVNCASPF